MTLPGQEGTIEQIATGGYDSFVLTSKGQLYAFGENVMGQLGRTPDNGANATPTLLTLPEGSGTIKAVAAGGYHTLVLTSSGRVYSFGENFYGQLGDTTNSGVRVGNGTPTLVSLPGASGTIEQIAAGRNYSLIRTSTGQLFAFGDNSQGQLGTTTNNGKETANSTPTQVGEDVNFVASGSFAEHTLVLGPFVAYVPPITVAPITPICGCLYEGPFKTPTPPSATPGQTTLSAPSISGARLTNSRFRVGKQATAIAAKKVPVGTILHFTLSAAARLKVQITHSVPGLRRGHSCVASSGTLVRAHAKPCTRTLTAGTFTRASETQGAGSFAFSGRVGHRPLPAGKYLAVIGASNAGGSSRAVSLPFAVVA